MAAPRKPRTAPPAPGTLAAGRAARQAACDHHHRGITDGERHVCLLCGAVMALAEWAEGVRRLASGPP
jgi:hypothetical protein